jgi:hypothetical protein
LVHAYFVDQYFPYRLIIQSVLREPVPAAETQRRHAELVVVLDEAEIPHLRSEVGIFTWLDLSAWLRPEDGSGDSAGGDPSAGAAAQQRVPGVSQYRDTMARRGVVS